MQSARENLSPQTIQRVAKELRRLVLTPLDGIRYLPQDEEQLTEIHVELAGPENTPYEGGLFTLKLVLSEGFPYTPPKGVFTTKIFHPNIAPTTGDICVNTLKKDWSSDLGIAHVLQVIRCLLIVPFPESSLNDEAGRLFMESYEEYARRARLWTNIHAKKTISDKEKKDTMTAGRVQKERQDQENHESPSKTDGDQANQLPCSSSKKTNSGSSTVMTASTTMKTPLGKRRNISNSDIPSSQKKKSNQKKGIRRL